jgi:hypothetical protein
MKTNMFVIYPYNFSGTSNEKQQASYIYGEAVLSSELIIAFLAEQ